MMILGLNAYHADASACLVIDGQLVAAAEEERFPRVKHWAGLPIDAVRYCLQKAEVTVEDIEHIAINRDPRAEGMMWRGTRLVKTAGPDNDERPDHWAMKRIH